MGKKTLAGTLVTLVGVGVTTIIDPVSLMYGLFIGIGLLVLWIVFIAIQAVLESRRKEKLSEMIKISRESQEARDKVNSKNFINTDLDFSEILPGSVEDLDELFG